MCVTSARIGEYLINVYDWVHTVHGEIQISVVWILSNQLDWRLLYKPFYGHFLPAIKVTDFCITHGIFICVFTFIFVLAIKEILPSLVCFLITNILIYDHLFTFTRDLEGRRMKIAQIYACVLLHFPLKAAAFDAPS